jgi:hypothetical protein
MCKYIWYIYNHKLMVFNIYIYTIYTYINVCVCLYVAENQTKKNNTSSVQETFSGFRTW